MRRRHELPSRRTVRLLAAVIVVATLTIPTAAFATPPEHGNAGGNGLGCGPPEEPGNPGQGNAGQSNEPGQVGNVCAGAEPQGPDHAGDPDGDGHPTGGDQREGGHTLEPEIDEPSGDHPSGDHPSDDDPVGDGPTRDHPSGDDPSGDGPTRDHPSDDDPVGDGPTRDHPVGDDPAADTPPAVAAPPADRCDDWLVTLRPDGTDGDAAAVAITAQSLEAGVAGWASATWEATPGTRIREVRATTSTGTASLDPAPTGTATGVLELTFCGAVAAQRSEDRTTADDRDVDCTAAAPAVGTRTDPPTAARTARRTATSTTLPTPPAPPAPPIAVNEARPAGTAGAQAAEETEVLYVQLDTTEEVPAPGEGHTFEDAAVTASAAVDTATGRRPAGLRTGGTLALAALTGLLLLARRRRTDKEVAA